MARNSDTYTKFILFFQEKTFFSGTEIFKGPSGHLFLLLPNPGNFSL